MGFYFSKGSLGWALITGVLLLQGGLLFFNPIFEIIKFREDVENSAKMQVMLPKTPPKVGFY